MLDWWRDRFPDLVVVVQSKHASLLPDDVRRVICDLGGGPARSLAAALPECDNGPITVIYADTWTPHVPEGDEWCGVAAAMGGRSWYVAEEGLLAYRSVGEDECALVGVGLFRFAQKWRLALALSHELNQGETGLDQVVNDLDLPFVPVVGWQDVGDTESLLKWRAA